MMNDVEFSIVCINSIEKLRNTLEMTKQLKQLIYDNAYLCGLETVCNNQFQLLLQNIDDFILIIKQTVKDLSSSVKFSNDELTQFINYVSTDNFKNRYKN